MEKAEKKGFDTGITVQNPLGGAPLPVWVANFVMMDYGTGASSPAPPMTSATLILRGNMICR